MTTQELDGYVYPDAWQAVGWVMELTPLAVVLLFPVYTLFWAKRRLPPGQSLWKKLISPTHNWGAIQCTCNIRFTRFKSLSEKVPRR